MFLDNDLSLVFKAHSLSLSTLPPGSVLSVLPPDSGFRIYRNYRFLRMEAPDFGPNPDFRPSSYRRPPVPIILIPFALHTIDILGLLFLIFIFSVFCPCGIGIAIFPLCLVARSFV